MEISNTDISRLISKLEVLSSQQGDILKDHEMRLRNLEKYLLGGIGAYSVLITVFTIYKEFFK